MRNLFRDPCRLITLTGPGGVGKTRLAIEVAEEMEDAFADGAAFVPLAAVDNPSLVVSTIARTLEIREHPDRSPAENLAAALWQRRMLLVLDNFEHLVAAAPHIAALLASCGGLTALVTSRIPLRLSIEQRFSTPPLALPEETTALDVAALRHYGAVALFVDRAQQAQNGFALDAANAGAVVEICRRVDGLPLAFELAAAWVRVLSPPALLERMELRLPLLRGGAEDLPIRHRTMRGAINWSYEFLSVDERQFLRQLAVFVGGFTLEASEWIRGVRTGVSCADPINNASATAHLSSACTETLDLLAALIDKSLAQPVQSGALDPRFTMLETVREFALERLVESGEVEAVMAAHAAHYLALAEAAAMAAAGADRSEWMRRLVAERPNLRAALDWLEQTGQTGAVLQMTGALWHYWYRLGDLAEGGTRLERALAASPTEVDPLLRARALRGAGVLAWQRADYDRSRERLEAALVAYRALGDRAGTAWVLNSLGCLFATLSAQERAEAYLTESLAIFRDLGDAAGAAQLTANLGELAGAEGHLELAIERLNAALAMWRALGDRVGAARAQVFLGQALLARDELMSAEAVLLEALTTIRDLDYEQILPAALRTVAHLAAQRGATAAAARWYGAENGVRETLGMALPAVRRAGHERTLTALREALGEAAFATAWADGRELSAAQVVADVLAGAGAATGPAPSIDLPAAGHELNLSPRELEVLALLCDGRSDREIASALYISPRTASSHMAAILGKLGARSRAEAAVRAVRDGLV